MTTPTDQPDFADDTTLLPAIVQHAETLQVLMLGYMNRQAWEHTLASRQVTFFSRSRQQQWTKGETSGHTLRLVSSTIDCDQDTILVMALPAGPTCHRNTTSCFSAETAPGPGFLAHLAAVIAQRAATGAEGEVGARPSYTSSLLAEGTPRVAQKVGEEAVETVIAAMKGDVPELINEAADLLYHLLVLLHDQACELSDVIDVLRERHRA